MADCIYKDKFGTPLSVGDIVSSSQSLIHGNGTVVTFNEGYVGLYFPDRSDRQWGHNLNGSCPEDHGGFWIKVEEVIIITHASGEAVKPVDEFQRQLSSLPDYLVAGDTVFELRVASQSGASFVLSQRTAQAQQAYQAASRRLEEQRRNLNAEFERKSADLIPCPNFPIAQVVEKNIRIARQYEYVVFILPITYAPKRFCYQNIMYDIRDNYKSLFAPKEITVFVYVYLEQVVAARLSHPDGTRFQHYHSVNDYDCTGSMVLPKITTMEELIAFRDAYQVILETINVDSLGNHAPTGCPAIRGLSDITRIAARADSTSTNTWTTAPPHVDIPVGARVKIISVQDHFPPEFLGVIGAVVYSYTSISEDWVTAEFVFPHSNFHDGHNSSGRPGHCYNFTLDKVELMPPGTRRTRPDGEGE